jgi:hypothetical protein
MQQEDDSTGHYVVKVKVKTSTAGDFRQEMWQTEEEKCSTSGASLPAG